ncbi:MAG: exosome complex exonuclease Rrp41 [Candidatus Pacearchaeota archaeon]
MTYTKRFDGRKADEMRPIEAKVNVVPRADGSAYFAFGDTKAVAAVYGPRPLHPVFLQNPEKGILRVYYDMLSFSVPERKKPGPARRSIEISHVTKKALEPVLLLSSFPNTVIDVFINILQANASTRCAGINAASLALAHAGIPMTDLVGAVSIGYVGGTVVTDLTKEEEDYEEDGEKMVSDIPMAFLLRSNKLSLLQLDGKVSAKELKEAIDAAKKACSKIYEIQKKALKEI